MSLFQGVISAIPTPFDDGGKIDYSALDRMLEFQVNAGLKAIVFSGTTGESPTLSDAEKLELFGYAVKHYKDKIKIIAGTGSNNTAHSITFSQQAVDLGVDALLLVTPYYNKPSQEGLYAHYMAIADAVDCPGCLYNVPGRTGIHMEAETVNRLAQHDRVVAIKEASARMEVIDAIMAKSAAQIDIVSGDDISYLDALKHGARGVISVASNVIPAEMVQVVQDYQEGRHSEAATRDDQYQDFYKSLFIDANPVPLKLYLSLMGQISYTMRLPLVPTSPANSAEIERYVKKMGLVTP